MALDAGVVTIDLHQDVLVLNCGSSSLKFGLFEVGPSGSKAAISGEISSVGEPEGVFWLIDKAGRETLEAGRFANQKEAVIRVLQLFGSHGLPPPAAVGHRIVHGGPALRQPCLIDDKVLHRLKAAAAFAPLHTPQALQVIAAVTDCFPDVSQVACFDTTFHISMPDVARVLPLPRSLETQGVYRYGFHGLSCESIVRQLAADLPERLVIAHLGNGSSITAVKAGESIDTSMGLTPSGGVMMGARSGDLDPGVVMYLMRANHFDAAGLETLLDHQSGLLGVSGVSSDMRKVRAAAASNPHARLAVDMFAYQVRKQIAAMIAVLGGIDGLVFTGGIGENDLSLRTSICDRLNSMGVGLIGLEDRNGTHRISVASSGCPVHVLPSQETDQIAQHAYAVACLGTSSD